MRLFVCLALSLLLHGLLLLPLPRPPAQAAAALLVELRPPELAPEIAPEPEPAADSLSTDAAPEAPLPAPPPPPKATPAPNRQAVRQAQSRLMEQLLYPPEAISQGLEGEVVLLLRLDGAGQVLDATVSRSSGYALLDTAAVRAALALGRLRTEARELLLPVEFALD